MNLVGYCLFSTSVELESENACMYVCMYVCPEPRDFKNDGIWLKFSHLFLGNVFFSFFIKFDFWGLGVFSQKEAKTLGQPRDFKNDDIKV